MYKGIKIFHSVYIYSSTLKRERAVKLKHPCNKRNRKKNHTEHFPSEHLTLIWKVCFKKEKELNKSYIIVDSLLFTLLSLSSPISLSATIISISSLLSNRAALSSLLSSSAASASSHFSLKSSRRLPWSDWPSDPGALGLVVLREESPEGGGRVKSIARNSRVSANVSKLQAMTSKQYSLIFMTPYLQ